MKNYVIVSIISMTLTALFFVSRTSVADPSKSPSTLTNTLPSQPPPTLTLNDPLPANLFVELGKAINPSVVNISTSAVGHNGPKDPMQEMLEKFYGIPSQDDGWNSKPHRVGLGTGFIIREDGLILTNAHVIRDADIIEVQLSEDSDKQYKAEVIGSDARADVALIKIKPDVKLSVASLGSSKDTSVGEWVAAFGNPYGHGHTMTKGIISSKGRAITEINKFPLLQTDASINPGNSGGPLVNSKGQVIGINSAIDARAQGIGFAIPIDEVRKILPELERNGSLKKGYIGVELLDLDPQTVAYLKLEDDNRSSLVRTAFPGGPADKSGLKMYDVITQIDDHKVIDTQDLANRFTDLDPGTKIKLKILRNNKGQAVEKVLNLTVGERPPEKEILRNSHRQGR
ncbi:MAG: S1C family serine protease [Pseudobdellovibrio sp.]